MSDESDIEAKFRKVVADHSDEIEEAIAEANRAIARAEKLSEKYGIPFQGPPSNFTDSYIPVSMPKGLDGDLIAELTGAFVENDWHGWQTSHC